jgi:hypothetical protein
LLRADLLQRVPFFVMALHCAGLAGFGTNVSFCFSCFAQTPQVPPALQYLQ